MTKELWAWSSFLFFCCSEDWPTKQHRPSCPSLCTYLLRQWDCKPSSYLVCTMFNLCPSAREKFRWGQSPPPPHVIKPGSWWPYCPIGGGGTWGRGHRVPLAHEKGVDGDGDPLSVYKKLCCICAWLSTRALWCTWTCLPTSSHPRSTCTSM
jgi:hypothetical protein